MSGTQGKRNEMPPTKRTSARASASSRTPLSSFPAFCLPPLLASSAPPLSRFRLGFPPPVTKSWRTRSRRRFVVVSSPPLRFASRSSLYELFAFAGFGAGCLRGWGFPVRGFGRAFASAKARLVRGPHGWDFVAVAPLSRVPYFRTVVGVWFCFLAVFTAEMEVHC